MVTLTAIVQAPVQALLRPSMWIPCFRQLHTCKEINITMEKFLYPSFPESCLEKISTERSVSVRSLDVMELLSLNEFSKATHWDRLFRWKVDVTIPEFISALLKAVELVKKLEENTECLDIHKVKEDGSFIRIFAFTRAEWLDVVEVTYTDGLYEVRSFSSGFFPLIIPCACLCNMICCAVPFFDFGANRRRLDRLRNAMDIPVDVVDTWRLPNDYGSINTD